MEWLLGGIAGIAGLGGVVVWGKRIFAGFSIFKKLKRVKKEAGEAFKECAELPSKYVEVKDAIRESFDDKKLTLEESLELNRLAYATLIEIDQCFEESKDVYEVVKELF